MMRHFNCKLRVAAGRFAIFTSFLLTGIGTAVGAEESVPETAPYVLPASALRGLRELANESDALILGEIHGTQEVPAVAAALLEPLHEMGYRILALEFPVDQQQALVEWASGKSTRIPWYCSKEFEDGRSNLQVLALIRKALAPPFNWKLVCFDLPAGEPGRLGALNPFVNKDRSGNEKAPPPSPEEIAKLAVRRDTDMAGNFLKERDQRSSEKALAICGNVHARTSRGAAPDDPLAGLWPSFAAALQTARPAMRVRSVNIEPCSGQYFAMVFSDDEQPRRGKSVTVGGARRVKEAEFRHTPQQNWHAELALPKVTPATFLAPQK